VVLIGVAGTMAGFPYLDAVAAVIVGAMIAHIGWELGSGAVQELVDTGLEAPRIEAIREVIEDVDGVVGIHMLRTRRLGGAASADVHVLVDSALSVSEGHMISLMVEQTLKREIDEIEDVTVHIDPEDDETAPPCLGLPVRSAALRTLKELWRDIAYADQGTRVVLHYLNGRVDVDVYFPLSVCDSDDARRHMETAMRQSVSEHASFGRLRVYYMSAP
jgi:hypothetical protein